MTKHNSFDLESSYAYQAYLLARHLRKDFFRIAKRAGHDLFPEQWFVLHFIVSNPGQSQSELAAHAFEDRPSLSRTLKTMVMKKLVRQQKDSQDLRSMRYWPTAAGVALHNSLVDTMTRERKRVFSGLSDQDHRDFTRIVSTLMKNL